jgi:8-oxo-dGTP diphosphatase
MMTSSRLPRAAVTVDLAVFTVRDDQLQVLLVERGTRPFLGIYALPGGFVEHDEDLHIAAARELAEETGLDANELYIEQLATYGAPERDPRGRVITVSYVALMPNLPLPTTGGDARDARWVPVNATVPGPSSQTLELAFDHRHILGDAVERVRSKLEYTTLATAFCPSEFSIAELRRIYEIIWGQPLDPPNFHRKVTSVPGLLTPTSATSDRDRGRSARLYRRGPATLLHPPILRASLIQAATFLINTWAQLSASVGRQSLRPRMPCRPRSCQKSATGTCLAL